jgi:peptide/nickel transport system substrate-binding protein
MFMMFTTPALAGKKDDTLYFSWQKELETLDRYYNTAREGMVVSRQICDDLLYRDPDTNEYKPLLAKSYKWLDTTVRASPFITARNSMRTMWFSPSTS